MKNRIITLLKYGIFLGLGIFLVWWQFSKMTPAQYVQFKFALSNANYKIIPLIIGMSLASHLSRSMRWKILIAPLGYNPSLFNTFGTTMIGYLANSFFPRLGEVLKCTLLGKYEKIPAQKLLGTILVERIFDLICYALFILITVLVQYQLVGDFAKNQLNQIALQKNGLPIWTKAMIYLALLIGIILLLRFLFKKYSNSKLINKTKTFTNGLKEGIATVKKLKNRSWFLFHTVFIWCMYLGQIYIGFSAMKEVSHLGWDAACGILTLATLAMIVTPNGLGTFPEAVLLVLGLYNIADTYGQAFGWLMWGTTTFIILLFGTIFLFLLMYLNKKKEIESNSTYS
ncbi:MAG: lysylphosphatidylglycerol synthase transmembrane domain-containing protein [Chitinophagaceae bacterium]